MADLPPLAQFLRSRRERLSPARAGLKVGGRRRTPGLRREELATLAGVSIDYLVRLEQGRDTNPSPDVLAALAEALQLDGDESRHLLGLAARASSPHLEQFCPAPPVLDAQVSPTVAALLDRLEPTPAFVVRPLGDVVDSNQAWRTLAAPVGLVAPVGSAGRPNLARHLFLHPAAPTTFPDWDEAADVEVARLRGAHRQLEAEPAFAALLGELLEVSAFAERWEAHPVSHPHRADLRFHHPDVGELHLSAEVMELAGHDQQLIAWLPADPAAEAVLARVLATERAVSPAQLRVVGEG